MGRGNLQKRAFQKEGSIKGGSAINLADAGFDGKRQRPTRNQPPPSTLPNVDVPGLIFAVLAIVFVVYPLAQWALGL